LEISFRERLLTSKDRPGSNSEVAFEGAGQADLRGQTPEGELWADSLPRPRAPDGPSKSTRTGHLEQR